MHNPTTTDATVPAPNRAKILSHDQCVLLLTGKPINIRVGIATDNANFIDYTIKIPDDLDDGTMVAWSLHNTVVRKIEGYRNEARSSAQDAWAEVADLREKLNGHDDRMHKAALAREEARAERDYERRRRQDDQAVWLETRDANKRLTDENKRLASGLQRYMDGWHNWPTPPAVPEVRVGVEPNP